MTYLQVEKLDRQYGSLDEIRPDHLKRYIFAAMRLAEDKDVKTVLDCACGCGYGSWMLHGAGKEVTAVDIEPEAIAYGERHYQGPAYLCQKAEETKGEWDALITFETLEHLSDPLALFKGIKAKKLIASVPNEALYPYKPEIFAWDKYPHLRHYTSYEFEKLLNDAGYQVKEWFCQKDKIGDVVPGKDGIFLIAVCG